MNQTAAQESRLLTGLKQSQGGNYSSTLFSYGGGRVNKHMKRRHDMVKVLATSVRALILKEMSINSAQIYLFTAAVV